MSSIASKEGGALTDLHWTVVAIARTDRPRSAEPEGRLTRFLRQAFGPRAVPRLASERLEALRCFCVRAWHRDVIRGQDMRVLIEAGYARSDAIEILMHIASCRGFVPALEEQAIRARGWKAALLQTPTTSSPHPARDPSGRGQGFRKTRNA